MEVGKEESHVQQQSVVPSFPGIDLGSGWTPLHWQAKEGTVDLHWKSNATHLEVVAAMPHNASLAFGISEAAAAGSDLLLLRGSGAGLVEADDGYTLDGEAHVLDRDAGGSVD